MAAEKPKYQYLYRGKATVVTLHNVVDEDGKAQRHHRVPTGFLMGVPARNLTGEDVEALAPEARAELEAHVETDGGLYEKAGRRPRRDEKDDDEEKEGDQDAGGSSATEGATGTPATA